MKLVVMAFISAVVAYSAEAKSGYYSLVDFLFESRETNRCWLYVGYYFLFAAVV